MHPKFDPTGIRTHGVQIMDSTFHVPETLAFTDEPSGAELKRNVGLMPHFLGGVWLWGMGLIFPGTLYV